ncbi:MAG: hypothetical protein JRI36_13185 [Deltaproteobacteria bacterium]|nr:hypothetical protein [Deltaproteobacteria bacterium]
MNCQNCGVEITEEDAYELRGQHLCEDCYLELTNRPQVCNPWAIMNAQKTRDMLGQSGTAGLTELQKRLYQFVKERDKVTSEEILARFNLTPAELGRQITVLRWCELVKGCKEGDKVFLTLM